MSCSSPRTRCASRRLISAVAGGCALIVSGCEALRGPQIDHPVLGPPPPRLTSVESGNPLMTADASDESGSEKPGIAQVSATEEPSMTPHTVVATVNGEPILASEILAGYQGGIAKARAKGLPESQIEQMKRYAIRQDLDSKIDQALLAQQLRLKLEKKQLEEMEKKLDEAYRTFLDEMMKKQDIPSRVELVRHLAKQGESLAAYEQHFKTQQLAQLYLFEQLGKKKKIFGRPDILRYYRDHQDEFSHEARARFQLLEVTFQKHGGRDEARERLDEALAALEAGTPFPTVCEKYSDDGQADRGGQWDWLKPGDFANEAVDEALFSQPVGSAGEVIETDSSFMVVRVTEREDAGTAPLSDVQEKIRAHLQQQHRSQAREQLFADLRENAVITKHIEIRDER